MWTSRPSCAAMCEELGGDKEKDSPSVSTVPRRFRLSGSSSWPHGVWKNLGKVTGMVEINFDKGLFSALHIMDGWQCFRLKDVSSAVICGQVGYVNKEVRWNIFLTRLDRKQHIGLPQSPIELHGSRRLCPDEISFSGEISESGGRLNFYLDCSFNADEVFGTHVETKGNGNWLNIYAEYDLESSQVSDTLSVILCREDGSDHEMAYLLNADEKGGFSGKDGPILPDLNTDKVCRSLLPRSKQISIQ